jgi:spermidine synthase
MAARTTGIDMRPAPSHATATNQAEQRALCTASEVVTSAEVPFAAQAILLAGSGAAALVYQTLWVKQLGLVVGVDIYAVTTAVSAFFAGLALGGAAFGALADRSDRPLGLYALLELGVAALGMAATLVLGRLAPPFVALEHVSPALAWGVPFATIGLPALLMGGTLPLVVRATRPDDASVGRISGWLYAANTAGGVAGTLATPFVLVPAFGVRGTAAVAASVNVLVAAAALGLGRSSGRLAPCSSERTTLPEGAGLALALYTLAGAIALGYEVVWSQAIVQFVDTRAYAFAIVLATYLAGLVVGSAVHGSVADTIRRPWAAFAVLEILAGASALGTLAALGSWLPHAQEAVGATVLAWSGSRALATCLRFVLAAAVLVLPPTLVLGAAFPAAVRLVTGARDVGRHVGSVTALNTLGGIGGTFLTGFVLVPRLGLVRTVVLLAVTSAAVGGVALVGGARRRLAAAAVALVAIVAVGALGFRIPREKLAQLLVATRGGTLDFYEESAGATVAVVTQPHFASSLRRLYIQGASNSDDGLMSLRYMRLQALLPLVVHAGEPRTALVIGLGTGITCGALLAYPGLEQRVCVELLPAVVRAASHFQGNFAVTTDPRVTLDIRDGRHELLDSTAHYDLITLEPPPPDAAGIVNLYSREFYVICRERLAPQGLLAQWWPLALGDDASRALVRSVLDVFPYVTLWTTEAHETMLVASLDPIVLDAPRIVRRFEAPSLRDALAAGGVPTPAALLATYVTDRIGLERFAGDAAPVTDDRPQLEYGGWGRPGEFDRVVGHVFSVRQDPPLLRAEPALREAIDTERRILMTFYQAVLHHYAGELDQMAQRMAQVMRADPENPYYRWFIGR